MGRKLRRPSKSEVAWAGLAAAAAGSLWWLTSRFQVWQAQQRQYAAETQLSLIRAPDHLAENIIRRIFDPLGILL